MDRCIQTCKNMSIYMYVFIFFNKFYTSKGEGFFSLVLFPNTLYSEYSKVPGT